MRLTFKFTFRDSNNVKFVIQGMEKDAKFLNMKLDRMNVEVKKREIFMGLKFGVNGNVRVSTAVYVNVVF